MTEKIVPILAGGGTRLPAHLGVLHALSKLQIQFDNIVGVSGGSIIASFFASGLSMDEMKEIALTTNYTQFTGFSLFKLIRNGGLSSGDVFEQWVDKHLQGKTFVQMDMRLHIVATDVRSGKPVIFNQENTPHMKVSEAVRYSMSIPLVFSFKPFGKHLMVDGSILSEDALHRNWAEDNTPVMCFRLRSEYEYDEPKANRYFPIFTYITLLIRTFMTTISREYINDAFWHNTIVINTGECSGVNFSMTNEQKLQLFDIGYQTALEIIPIKTNASPTRQPIFRAKENMTNKL